MTEKINRRQFLQTVGITLALIPLVAAKTACAKTNTALRTQLHYQNTPKQDMSCASCLEFIAGKNATDLGGCKVIPDDDGISPNAYCTSWNSM